MKLACRLSERNCADGVLSFKLMSIIIVIFAAMAFRLEAADPGWWTSRGAINSNPKNDYAAVTQGQLKQFTARAVDELNADLTNYGGAGTALTNLVYGWQQDYATHGYNAMNIEPSDYKAMNVGQLKYIGGLVWTRLVAVGYTNSAPSWLVVNTNTDNAVANLGQLKTAFNFDLSAWHPPDPYPQITSPATVTTAVDATFSYAITATHNPTSFSATGLPGGLSVNGTTGVISGTPTATGIFSVNLSATNASRTGTGVLVINVGSTSLAPVISSPTTATATAGYTFAYRIRASNNPTLFGATNLPTGLSINSTTGAISGTVTTAGAYSINLSASNGAGTGTVVLSLAINSGIQSGALPPVITSSLTVSATTGQSFSYSITAGNSPTSYGATGLPGGLSVNTSTGVISGTPANGGPYSVFISATNANGTTSDILTIAFTTPVITSSTTASATVGAEFIYTITATGNPTGYSASSLPGGLTLDTTNGIISGAPTDVGTDTIGLGVTNSTGTGSATLTLTVSSQGAPVITSPAMAYFTIGQSAPTYTIAASNSPTSFSASGLPAGLSINTTTGVISGTPTAVGTTNVVITALNALGSVSSPLTIVVQAATGSVTATMVLQAGASPSASYTTTSAGIANDTSQPALANGPLGSLIVGASSTTQTNRTLLGFDLSAVPTGATITSASLTLQGNTSSAFTVKLYQTTAPFSPANASWTNNNSYQSTLLSSLAVSSGSGPETWPSADNFISAVQAVVTNGGPLDLMLVSPTAESSGTVEYLTLLSENVYLSSSRPALTITYTSSAPPVITGGSTGLSVTSGVPFSYPILTLNGATSYAATGLPSGLSINSSTGVITGTTTANGTYPVTISATNANGADSVTLTVTVANPTVVLAPIITSPNMAYATAGTAFSYASAVTNGPVTFSATGLPSGITIDSTTGIISGTPTTSEVGTPTITISATNAAGTATAPLLLVVQSSSSTVTATLTLQAGVSPSAGYQTTSAGLATDTSLSDLAGESSGFLAVGRLTSTQKNRVLLGFDLSVLPPGAAITSASLTLNAEISAASYSATTYDVELHEATGSLSQLDDVQSATWTNDNGYDSTVLSTLTATLPTTATEETWSSSSAFVSATQTAASTGTPLFLMLVSPTIETGTAANYFYFDDETVPYTPPTPTTRPALSLTYTTSAPPVIVGSAPIFVTPGFSFSYQVPAVNGATSYSATGLPAGLSIDTSTGIISGTSTQCGTFTVTVTATNGNGSGTTTLTLNIGAAPAITSALTASATVNSSFSYTITASHTTNATPTYSASTLPAGLMLNPTTGVISGTPTAGGYHATVTLGVTTIYGTDTASLVITFVPVINGTLTASGNVGIPFSYDCGVSANNYPTSFSVTGSTSLSSLGLSLASSTGIITGTPTATGTYPFAVTATNSAGTSSSVTLTITVADAPILTLADQSVNWPVNVNYSYAEDNLPVSYNPPLGSNSQYPTFSYTVDPSTLWAGLTTDDFENITGTPTTTGTDAVGITVIDSFGNVATGTLNLLIYSGPGIDSALTANTDVGQNFQYTIHTLQEDVSSYGATGLPVGLSINTSTGVISGMPTTPGTSSVNLSATDSSGTSTATLVLTVGSITSPNTATANVGASFIFCVGDTNSPTSFQASNLPPGLSINSTTGFISGTPVAADTVPITLTVADALGTATQTLLLTIAASTADTPICFQQGVSPTFSYSVPSVNIAKDTSNSATADQTFTTGTVLTVGQTTATASSRALLGFDLSALPSNAVITSAYLVMNTSSGNSSGAPFSVEIHQAVTQFATATATWNNNNDYNDTLLSSLTLDPSVSAASTFSVTTAFTQAVQQAYNSNSKLYLSLLAPAVEGAGTPDYIGFVTNATTLSQNPKLILTYTVGSSTAKPVITSATTVAGTVNVSLTYNITATNDPTSYSATGLPSGLSLNTSTGAISGTVTTIGSTVATVSATNALGTGSQTVTFNIDNATPANGLQVLSGNNQVGVPGTFLALPLVVQASSNGTSWPNALVTFTVPPGEGGFALTSTGSPATSNTLTVVTNSSGQATVYFLLPQSLRTTTIIVSAGTAQPVSMVETSALNTSGSANAFAFLSVIRGEGQSGPAGQTLPHPFVVQATSVSGQPVSSQSLSLTVTAGGGGISSASGSSFGSTLSVSTDGYGKATIYMQPGSSGPANRVSCVASASGVQATVYLTALTSSTSSSSPMPGGGTPPQTDGTPPPWNGSAWIVEADRDNGNTPTDPNNPDPTQIDIHWTPTTGTNITGFLIEKKVSTGQWYQLAEEGTGAPGYCEDTGLLANEAIQYRVSPYINGVLGSPCAPVTYEVPLIKAFDIRTSIVNSGKPGWGELTDPSVPPKYYLTQVSGYSYSYQYYSGPSQGQGVFNSTETIVPAPNPQLGSLQFNPIFSGSCQQSNGDGYGNFYSEKATLNPPSFYWQDNWSEGGPSGVTTGTSNDSGEPGPYYYTYSDYVLGAVNWMTPVTSSLTPTTSTSVYSSNLDNTTESASYQNWEILSNEYTTKAFIDDVNASLPDYGPWQHNWYGWGLGYWGGWNWENDNYEGLSIARRTLSSDEVDYRVDAALYKLEAYPAKNSSVQWAEVFVAQDNSPNPTPDEPGTSIMRINSWNINSSSESDSSVYELNPLEYSSQYGYYYLTPVPYLYVFNGAYPLDSEEKTDTGTQVSLVTGVVANSLGTSGPGTFYISNEIPGSTYTLSWSESGSGTLQVWGQYWDADTYTLAWEQVGNGTPITLGDQEDGSGSGSDSGWTGQFDVIATSGAQNNDSINLTLTSYGPGGASLGTDSSKFYYSNPPDLSIPIDEASGSRYRKIALNGLPMADEKPQQSAESNQEKEETYVDALTLGLRHSTTDVYLPVSGSDFSVSARRDFRSQIWEDRNGLRPHEQPDLPFGVCWSSNLAPNIKLTHNSDPKSTTPDQAIVTDETGAVHTFFRWYDATGAPQFFPMPTAKNEAQVPNLETLAVNSSTNPVTYTFTRKYGATLTYKSAWSQSISNDRLVGSAFSTTYQYARLVQATDRVGNTVNYQFQGTTNLIPATITVTNQPRIKLSIEQKPISGLAYLSIDSPQSVITAIWDANGNKTCYHYCAAPGDPTTVMLDKVTTPDGATTHYSYDATTEPDLTPHAPNSAVGTYSYVDISSITDPLGHAYAFSYVMDHSKRNFMNNPQIPYDGYYTQSGSPRNIATVTMPDNTTGHPDVSTFVNNSQVYLKTDSEGNLTVGGQRVNTVTDATGTGFTRTYTFGSADVVSLPSFPQLANNVTESKLIAYQSLTISYGNLGSETFQFDINAAMALKQITDFSGNVTMFAHTDAWSAPTTYSQRLISGTTLNGNYDDPTKQTDALGHYKTFTYQDGSRIMKSITDENGNKTCYDIDSLGRRTTEKLYDHSSTLVQETDFVYGSTAYPGFMTQKTVKATGSGNPSWAADLVTQYTPDRDGRVAHETVDPGGLNLVTTYTYDANGNKLTATDPKGNTTWFSYDSRNRLVTVTNADGSQKQMVYDSRGNKVVDYDENGIATLYQYDSLNRLIMQVRDMNGNGGYNASSNTFTGIDSGVDLITQYTYNNVNSKLTVTDPNGSAPVSTTNPNGATTTTTMAYDNLQRVTTITDALSNVTHFSYGANSGGNAFDSSSFKPTQTIDPRGFATDIRYDVLYRPTFKSVHYGITGDTSNTSTQYDNVGNVTLTTDPCKNSTQIAYDALNRPTLTTAADGSTTQAFYASTGFKWKTIDQNGNISQTQYDNAGRLISVTNGYGTSVAATTTSVFDAAANLAETVNPLGNVWDYAYDARNRKVQEFEPAVADADPNSPTYNTSVRPILRWKYDLAGRVTATIDARNNKTDTTYDAANRVVKVCQPDVSAPGGGMAHPITLTSYDFNGNILTLTDPNTHVTTNTYDALNRLLTSTDTVGIVVTNTYDPVGNKLTVTDGRIQTTTFRYDGLNRNTEVIDAAGRRTHLKYDGLNKIQRTDALGQVTTYLYDVRNRLSNVVYAPSAAPNSQRNYAYDGVGNLLSVTEPSKTAANVIYCYDALNRVTHETSGGLRHHYTYDLVGNRLSTVYGGTGRTIVSTYDALNRLSAMTESGRVTSYGYDLNGNIVSKTLPNLDVESDIFDALNRASAQSAVTSGSASLYAYGYAYDLAGNVLTVNETYPSGLNNRLVTNAYDAINRLHTETVTGSAPNVVTTYDYDAANNRSDMAVAVAGSATITTNYYYNNLNQLTIWTLGSTAVNYTYDLDGNRTTRVVSGGSDNGTDTYSYDFENRLIGLVKGTAGGAGTYAYTYDYRTRRIVRDESSAGGAITHLVFSGGTSVQEYDGTTPSLTVEYIRGSDYGGGVGGILYTLRGGTPSYTHANKRGDIVAKTNGSGTVTFAAQYEAFGNQVGTYLSTLDRQKSNSKDTDPTGLVDEGFRYRDLETGMFISRDPAGFVDGPNLYTYVIQNPWTKFDPEGLDAVDVALKVGEQTIKNAKFAGKVIKPDQLSKEAQAGIKDLKGFSEKYKDGVKYNDQGFPVFTPYAKEMPNGEKSLKFDQGELTGNMGPDVSAARDKLRSEGMSDAQIKDMESGNTWHHVEGGMEMELVPTDLHDAYKHTGGRATINAGSWFSRLGSSVAGAMFGHTIDAQANGTSTAAGLTKDAIDMTDVGTVAKLPVDGGKAMAGWANGAVNAVNSGDPTRVDQSDPLAANLNKQAAALNDANKAIDDAGK